MKNNNNNNKKNKNNSKEGTAESVKGQRAVAPLTLINPSRLIGQSGKGLNMEFLHVDDKFEKDTCNSNRHSNATNVNDLVTFIVTLC